MVEVFDYYAQGLDRRKDVVELHRSARKELETWRKRAQGAKPGTPAAADAAKKQDLWAKAYQLFATPEGRKAYDAQLTVWQASVEAQRAKGQADQSAKEFASATETVLELVARAWEELDSGNLRAAYEVASKAMRIDASNWEPYLIAGISSFRQDDFEESMSCLRQAARLNPNSAHVFSGLGELYERQDNWEEAFNNYSKAIALAPDEIEYKIKAGFVCVKADVPDQGIALLRKALEMDPDHEGAKWALGLALADSAQFGWTEVLEGHPRVEPGWYAMSREQALQAIRKLHEANALGVVDEELAAHLVRVKKNVDSNVERHFNGSWVIFGFLLLVAVLSMSKLGTAFFLAAFAAAYYAAQLVPQYAQNARVLAGDGKLKRGFLDWFENIQTPWIKLSVSMVLIMLLPIFTIYWAVKNWTGENAPLGEALNDISGPKMPIGQGAQPVATGADSAAIPSAAAVPSPAAVPRTAAAPRPAAEATKLPQLFDAIKDIDKKVLIGIGSVVALALALAIGSQLYKSKNAASSNVQSAPQGAKLYAPNAQENKSDAIPSVLESKWFGTWVTSDGTTTMEISAQKIKIESRGHGEPNQPASKTELVWTNSPLLQEGQFGYSGARTSPLKISQEFEAAVKRVENKEPDFGMNSPISDSRKWIAKMVPGNYQILSGYHGGDSEKEWILDDGGNLLEINKSKYFYGVNLWQRSPSTRLSIFDGLKQSDAKKESAASVNAPIVRAGDTYTYETLDQIDPKMNNVTTREIASTSGSGFQMNFVNAKSKYTRQLSYDSNLNLTASRSGNNEGLDYSPALRYFSFPLKTGDTWNANSTERNIKTGKMRIHSIRAVVGEFEQVTVPAGTFKAIKISIDSEVNDESQITTGRDISWYAPDIRRTVKSELESRDSAGKVGRRTVQLVTYRLQ